MFTEPENTKESRNQPFSPLVMENKTAAGGPRALQVRREPTSPKLPPSFFELWRTSRRPGKMAQLYPFRGEKDPHTCFCETNPFYFRGFFDASVLFTGTCDFCRGVCKWVRSGKTNPFLGGYGMLFRQLSLFFER